jgi:hypothetical protein
MNDADRQDWVDTSLEGFYREQLGCARSGRQSRRAYIRANRESIDAVIRAMPGTEALFRGNDRAQRSRARRS